MFEWFGRVSFVTHTRLNAFAEHLREGRIMGSRCTTCGGRSLPPRSDCANCLSDAFEYVEVDGHGTLLSYTTVVAAPAGFDHDAPYTLGLVELEGGGRLVGWLGSSFATAVDDIKEGALPPDALDRAVRVIPRLAEDIEPIRLIFEIEPAT